MNIYCLEVVFKVAAIVSSPGQISDNNLNVSLFDSRIYVKDEFLHRKGMVTAQGWLFYIAGLYRAYLCLEKIILFSAFYQCP